MKLPRRHWGLAGLIITLVVVLLAYAGNHSLGKKPTVAASYGTAAARNELRRADLTQLAVALNAYVVAHPGDKLPVAIPVSDTDICTVAGANCKTAHFIDLGFLVNPANLLRSIPTDPVGSHVRYSTGFTIGRDQVTGKFRFSAPRTEDASVIVVEQ